MAYNGKVCGGQRVCCGCCCEGVRCCCLVQCCDASGVVFVVVVCMACLAEGLLYCCSGRVRLIQVSEELGGREEDAFGFGL
jgi:hypothetical protein